MPRRIIAYRNITRVEPSAGDLQRSGKPKPGSGLVLITENEIKLAPAGTADRLAAGFYYTDHDCIEAAFEGPRVAEVFIRAAYYMGDDEMRAWHYAQGTYQGVRDDLFCLEAADNMERETRFLRNHFNKHMINCWERFLNAYDYASSNGFVRFK